MILREIGADDFTYTKFKSRLDTHKKKFNPEQLSGLDQRMLLLESFLEKGAKRTSVEARFDEGQLTIVDLTDPFIDAGHANALFEIVTRLFERVVVNTGKVLVVDEAHKVGNSRLHLWWLSNVVPLTVSCRGDTPRQFLDDHDKGASTHRNPHNHQHAR